MIDDVQDSAVATAADEAVAAAVAAEPADTAAAAEQPNEIDVLTAERDMLASARDHAEALLTEVQVQLAAVTAERDALQAAAERASAAPKVARAQSGGKARKVAVMANPKADELLEAIAAAETVEVVFSDGARELVQIPALVVSGTVWAKMIGGLALRVPELLVYGPAVGQTSWPLAGYGLFLDGKQAAWAARADVLQIGGGMQVNLRDDVIFPAD